MRKGLRALPTPVARPPRDDLWAMMRFAIAVLAAASFASCVGRHGATPGATPAPRPGVSASVSSANPVRQREPAPDRIAASRDPWEDRIPVGLPEQEFLQIIENDSWASRWMKKGARTVTGPELRDWAASRATFVGDICHEAVFLETVGSGGPFHLYSAQGIPSTTHQLTVVCRVDDQGVWRVAYRAVRRRPCI